MGQIKVLHIMSRADFGGISTLIYNYYRELQASSVIFHVLAMETSYRQQYEKIFTQMGMEVFFMPEQIVARLAYFSKLIHQQKYDIIHAHVELTSAIYLSVAMLGGVKARIAHTHLSIENKGLKDAFLKGLINFVATHRVGCSQTAIVARFGKRYLQKSTVIHNAVDPSIYAFDPKVRTNYRQALGIADRYVVGFVGRLTALKNLPYLLDVFKALHDTMEPAVLIVVGDGELREQMESQVTKLGLSQHVLFLGNRLDVSELLMAMDVLLLPSLSEGFGLVLVEAQATGLKCIASLDRVPKETSLLENYSYYESIDQPPAIWAALILSKCIQYERKNMEVEIGLKQYDVRQEAVKLIAFYEQVLQNKRRYG